MGNTIITAIQKVLEVADRNMNLWQPNGCFNRLYIFFFVNMFIGNKVKRWQSIRLNLPTFFKAASQKLLYGFTGNRIRCRHGNKPRVLPRRSTAAIK